MAAPYDHAVNLCIEAYKADRTPASWRMPRARLREFATAFDAVGAPLCVSTGDGWRMMGLPVEILADAGPEVVLSLIAIEPRGPAPKPAPTI